MAKLTEGKTRTNVKTMSDKDRVPPVKPPSGIKKKVKKKVTKKKRGAPTKYKEEYDEQARKLCLLGATDKELANFFNVNEDTINEWKKVFPNFSVSINAGKAIADAEVVNKLYNRAMGYECTEKKFAVMKTVEGKSEAVGGEQHTIKEYPPDTTAIIYWLNNRQRDKWRNTQHTIIEEEQPQKTKKDVLKEINDLKKDLKS